jgi:hypothetical protein
VHANGLPESASGELPTGDESRFLPILARIIDLGRGSPELVLWVQMQLEALNVRLGSLESARGASILVQLARELARLLSHDERMATLLLGDTTNPPTPSPQSRFR